jgi:hypothetical protein
MMKPVFFALAYFWMSVEAFEGEFDREDVTLVTTEGNARYLWFNATYLPTVVFMWGLLFTLIAAFAIIYYTGVRNFDNRDDELLYSNEYYYSDSRR